MKHYCFKDIIEIVCDLHSAVMLTHCASVECEMSIDNNGWKMAHITHVVLKTQINVTFWEFVKRLHWKNKTCDNSMSQVKQWSAWQRTKKGGNQKEGRMSRDNERLYLPDILGGIPSLWRQLSTLRVVHWRVQYRNAHISILKQRETAISSCDHCNMAI